MNKELRDETPELEGLVRAGWGLTEVEQTSEPWKGDTIGWQEATTPWETSWKWCILKTFLLKICNS